MRRSSGADGGPKKPRSRTAMLRKRGNAAKKVARISSPTKTEVEGPAKTEAAQLAPELQEAREPEAGGDSRGPEPHRRRADGSAAGVRQDRQERRAALPECAQRRLSPGWRACPFGRARSVLARIGGGSARSLPCPAHQQQSDLGRHPRAARR